LLDLLEVPALRRRFDTEETDLPLLRDWALGAGVRWGLHADHRAALGLPPNLEQNSWRFGLRRMLLGYATGRSGAWQDIEPYDEVGGLQAALAGKLVDLIETLDAWWRLLSQPADVPAWGERLRALLEAFFQIQSDQDLALQAELLESLDAWQADCREAGFDEALPLHLARQSWTDVLTASRQSQRFLAGRINFCTLMPMRSIPFRVVCLLGMNEADYPRRQMAQDFDLMSVRGQYRPGDRSRRDDDRYLFLEAVLSARDHLYISWVGLSARDNEPQPPSVLVAQLRDFLDAAWQINSAHGPSHPSEVLTQAHPLQPFSTNYFNGSNPGLFTYAEDWRAALQFAEVEAHQRLAPPDAERRLSPAELGRFLRAPVDLFFAEQLQVRFDELGGADDDAEPFALDRLDEHQTLSALLDAARDLDEDAASEALQQAGDSLQRSGALPLPPFADPLLEPLIEAAEVTLSHWRSFRDAYPTVQPLQELSYRWPVANKQPSLMIEHWQPGLRKRDDDAWLLAVLTASSLKDMPEKMLNLWVVHLLACANGLPLTTVQIGRDQRQTLPPISEDQASEYLSGICAAWCENQCAPLPLAPGTAFTFLKGLPRGRDPALNAARNKYETNGPKNTGEVDYGSNAALKRAFPTFESLLQDTTQDRTAFEHWAEALYTPLLGNLQTEKL
jgi:exodeoxyribonuclease V gamma subunit